MQKPRAWITTNALNTLITEAERRYPNETGGLLIGYSTNDDVIITAVTTPGPYAHHTSTQYVPDAEHDQEQVAKHYEESGRLHTYLGDWHTHPDAVPYLSPTDANTLRRIASTPTARQLRPLMCIAGGRPGAWLPIVWRHDKTRPAALQLTIYNSA
jgi:integrative and conjugative element protein (TIGR02256 family)